MFLKDLLQTFRQEKIKHALAGGFAVSLHGVTRGTVDIDLVVSISKTQLKKCEKALQGLGLVSSHPVHAEQVFEFREEYVSQRNMIAWNFYHPHDPSKVVDLLIAYDLADYEVMTMKAMGLNIRVLSLESLIKMKSLSPRKQDQEDVKALKYVRKHR